MNEKCTYRCFYRRRSFGKKLGKVFVYTYVKVCELIYNMGLSCFYILALVEIVNKYLFIILLRFFDK